MLNKSGLIIFCSLILLVGILASVFVMRDGVTQSSNKLPFLDIYALRREFPVGSNIQSLEEKIESVGYREVSCAKLPKLVTKLQTKCFWMRYCYRVDGWVSSVIGIAYDKDEKLSLIEGGGYTLFHLTCEQSEKANDPHLPPQ